MKHVQRVFCLVAVIVMLLQCGVSALAADSLPPLPALYWGSVKTATGNPVISGVVEAVVDGDVCGSINIDNGMFGSTGTGTKLVVQGDFVGKTVHFRVNGTECQQTIAWKSDDCQEVNLIVNLTDPPVNPSPLIFNSDTLSGTKGQPYSYSFVVSGGATPYSFAITAGKLPDGLTLSNNGVITGTPTSTGEYNFSVTVTDKLNTKATQSFSLTINQASVTPPAGGGVSGGGGSAPQTKQPLNTISDKVLQAAISQSANTGKVTVQVPAGESHLALSFDQWKDIQGTGKPLETKVNNITMAFAPGSLKVPQLSSGELNQVQFTAAPVDRDEAKEAIAQANRGGLFNIAGEVFELSACVVLKDGSQKNIKQFNGKIQVSLPVPQSARGQAAEGRLTVGYYNEQTKTWQNIAGQYNPVTGTITFETNHLSKYAVIEVKQVQTTVFKDIANHWARADIEFMADKGFVGGVGNGVFAPEANITRAQFAAFLVRILDVPQSNTALNFTDVKAGDWYYVPLAAAYQAGLVKGVTADKIAPNENITREQMAVMLVRAMEEKGKTIPSSLELTFSDKGMVSPWAVAGVSQSAQLSLIGGYPNGTFQPRANATRAQAIVMLHRLYEQIQ
ncbi:Ig family protein [Desulforamulus reducens MI-1]|uniref:Ig family protein n=1 Tax=Desulforamulus reducens (strain ATCC BAA-1160 / DSM 100696 / MI-1) TaxID=349161 RepID=A4J940_DESRM|nr:S-layer homology domain-containing protein [Desulforamulus reducens]ABO51593.1 Ig family protein [Desulforamulus reducens MI-1]